MIKTRSVKVKAVNGGQCTGKASMELACNTHNCLGKILEFAYY